MTNYATFVYPETEFYQQGLTTSLDDGLNRPEEYELSVDIYPEPLFADLTANGATFRTTRSLTAFVLPTWADQLFGRFLIIPARLDLGNVLSNQTRTVEIANLFLETHDWSAVDTDVIGLTFNNLPVFGSPVTPHPILSFGSFLMQIGISAEGPATIAGDVELTFDVGIYVIPVTGRRIVIWQFQPRPGIVETLFWATDILEANDGTEQRISLREAPRSAIKQSHLKFDNLERRIRTLLVDWLSLPFALPVWSEARRSTASAFIGTLTISVPTDSADFRVGGLAFVYLDDETYDAVEIDTVNPTNLVLSSELTHTYGPGVLVMPAVTAYANTVPSTIRLPGGGSETIMEFTTIAPAKNASIVGSTIYDGKVLLDDCNLITSGEADAWERPVIVMDSESGRLFQSSRTDRSRFRTRKQWDSDNRAETWRVRQLLHTLMGNRVSFFLPSFRADMILTQTVGAAGTTMRVAEHGYSNFVQARRPFADMRMVLLDGTVIVRGITGATADGTEDVLTLSASLSNVFDVAPEDVDRIEIVNLVRISDDQATFDHRRIEDAKITINVVSVKE